MTWLSNQFTKTCLLCLNDFILVQYIQDVVLGCTTCDLIHKWHFKTFLVNFNSVVCSCTQCGICIPQCHSGLVETQAYELYLFSQVSSFSFLGMFPECQSVTVLPFLLLFGVSATQLRDEYTSAHIC